MNNFCGLSLDKIDHVIQIGRWLSKVKRRPIWYSSSDFISMEEKPRNKQIFKLRF